MPDRPLLRPLDFQPVYYQNQQMWLLRDPLQLSETQLIFPGPMSQLLTFLDGTRTPAQIHEAFCHSVGARVEFGVIEDALAQLDAALLLDNENTQRAQSAILATFRAQPHRPPALAGLGYPDDPAELMRLFEGYLEGAETSAAVLDWHGRGLISPHIDYARGGTVYAKTWRHAATAVGEADLVLIFGTDHYGGAATVTLTRLPYATPFGILPTDHELIDTLAQALGPEHAFAEELHHRQEHSVELSAVWLHYALQRAGRTAPAMIPILVGSFHHFVENGMHPSQDPKLGAFIDALQQQTADRRVLAVASVDLAHVGPNFGDPFPMDAPRRRELQRRDEQRIAAAVAGDASAWYEQIAGIGDQDRVCGFAPTYLLLRFLGPGTGRPVAYTQCPADPGNDSLVSICGLLLD